MDLKSLSDLRKLSAVELRKFVAQQREALRELSFRVATLEHKNVHEVAVLRKSVAQGETLLREQMIASEAADDKQKKSVSSAS